MSKHYIKIDLENYITQVFSDDFIVPCVDSICIRDAGGRHFEINGIINPTIQNFNGQLLYKYEDGKIIQKTKPMSFEQLQNIKLKEIDQLTRDNFNKGFAFDGQMFSLSLEAQSNWSVLNILNIKEAFPDEGMTIATKNSSPYLLTKENSNLFCAAAFTAGQTFYQQGLNEKTRIYNINTYEQLNDYKDIRLNPVVEASVSSNSFLK